MPQCRDEDIFSTISPLKSSTQGGLHLEVCLNPTSRIGCDLGKNARCHLAPWNPKTWELWTSCCFGIVFGPGTHFWKTWKRHKKTCYKISSWWNIWGEQLIFQNCSLKLPPKKIETLGNFCQVAVSATPILVSPGHRGTAGGLGGGIEIRVSMFFAIDVGSCVGKGWLQTKLLFGRVLFFSKATSFNLVW